MFGKLMGAGVGGYVFESTLHNNRCYKIVALPDKPLKFFGLKSDVGRVYAINENQADLFRQLSKKKTTTSALPKVYNYYEGKNNQDLMEATRQENFYLPLPIGQSLAVWEMEKIPCISSNNFCGVSHPKKEPLQNRQYQSLLHYLLDEGWVVRDVAADDNYGYRKNGEQVWFDPVVAPWPKGGITPSMKNSSNPTKANQYESFIAAYGSNQLSLLHQSLNDKRYFGYYHQGGVLHAEESLEFEPPSLNPKLFYDLWGDMLLQDSDYRITGALNFSYSAVSKRKAVKAAYQFWEYLYSGGLHWDEDSYMGIVQGLIEHLGYDEDKNHEGQEVFDRLNPNNLLSVLWEYTNNTTTKRVYGEGDKRYVATTKIIPPDLDVRQKKTLLDRELVIAAQMSSRQEAYGSPWTIWPDNTTYPPLCSYKDFIHIQEEVFATALKRIASNTDYTYNCLNCGGDGRITNYGPAGQEHETTCKDCEGEGTFDLETKWNDWFTAYRSKNILQRQLYGYDNDFLEKRKR